MLWYLSPVADFHTSIELDPPPPVSFDVLSLFVDDEEAALSELIFSDPMSSDPLELSDLLITFESLALLAIVLTSVFIDSFEVEFLLFDTEVLLCSVIVAAIKELSPVA